MNQEETQGQTGREDLSDGLHLEFAPSGDTTLLAVLGVVSLIASAFALTRVDSAFAGRAYAAYGGIYIAASLVWLWLIEGQAPTRTDLLGAALAVSGALIIIGFAARVR